MTMTHFARAAVAPLALIACLVAPAAGAAEAKEHILFDGKGTAGWKQCGPGSFEVVDGALVSRGGMGLFWFAQREFGDFVYTLEWKTTKKDDNSGVYFRFPDPGNDPWNAVKRGYEVQIHDAAKKNRTGSVYNVKEATSLASKPPGEWNTFEIKAVGRQVTIKLNGTVVNDFTGKLAQRGYVGIQNHDANSTVAFRNIRVIELDEPAAVGPAKPQAGGEGSGKR